MSFCSVFNFCVCVGALLWQSVSSCGIWVTDEGRTIVRWEEFCKGRDGLE